MNERVETVTPQFTPVRSELDELIRIFVIANRDIYVDGLIRVIGDLENHQVVACINPNDDCYRRFSENPADVLLIEQAVVNQCLQEHPAEELFSEFHRQHPGLRIIIFGHEIADSFVRKMIRAGAHGFIDGNTTQKLLAAAIQEVHNGGYWVGRKALERLIYSAVEMERIIEQGIREKICSIQDTLTKRESDVLQLVLEGMSTREIANELCLSEQGVKLHLSRLFKKFDVTNRSQLILMAFQRVCPVSNMINLFRKSLDRRRINKGQSPVLNDPLSRIN